MRRSNDIRSEASTLLKSDTSRSADILPVLNIGGFAVHVPYHTTWAHEQIDSVIKNDAFQKVENISEVISLLK